MATGEQSQTVSKVQAALKKPRSYSRHKTNLFIEKTFDMLEQNQFVDAVSWDDTGGMIVIKDLSTFVTTVLPNIFDHHNFHSFVRQLNLYNFKKKKFKSFQYVYCHPYFQHGRRELLGYVIRQPIYKKKKAKLLSQAAGGSGAGIGGGDEEGANQAITKKQNDHMNNQSQIEAENMKMRDEIKNLGFELQTKDEYFRKCSERNLELRFQMKIQTADIMMLYNSLKERMPPSAFELFRAQESKNLMQMQLMDQSGRPEMFDPGLKLPANLMSGNNESIYIPRGAIDEQIDRNHFNTEFSANQHFFRQHPMSTETEEPKAGYHIMNPFMREPRDVQNPIFLQRLDQNAFKHNNLFFNGHGDFK